MLTKIENGNGPETDPPWGGVGGGWLLMMIGDAMTPLTPFDPPVWPRVQCYLTSNSMLQSSMFPYSMLIASTEELFVQTL